MPTNNKTLIIAWREFKSTVLRPVFIIAILGLPLLFLGLAVVSGFMINAHEEPPLVGTIAIIDSTGELTDAAEYEFSQARLEKDRDDQLKAIQPTVPNGGAGAVNPGQMNAAAALQRGEVNIAVERIDPNADDFNLEDIKAKVSKQEYIGAVVVPDALLETGNIFADAPPPATTPAEETTADDNEEETPTRFDLYIAPFTDSDHISLIERRLGQAIVRVRAERANLDPDQTIKLFDAPRSSTRQILETGLESAEDSDVRELKQFIPMAFMMLLWLGVFIAGQHLIMSTIEEKSTRVMEVLLSAVSPLQLMTGKIIGHGAVGLLITGIYTSVGVAGLIALSAMHFIDPISIVYLAIYFFMAYFMIASLMAAVGGAVSDVREANTLLTPIMLTLWIPWMLWFPIIQDPNGMFATIISFVPPVAPFVMILRTSADEAVPFWQIPATIVWGYLCVFAMIWMAAKIFRVGVLMYGKPPSFIQLVKWLRYS